MPLIMHDKYILGQSEGKAIEETGEEINIDLLLKELNVDQITGGQISGVVRDSAGNPISGALIKLMSTNYTPLMHILSDSQGNYSIKNIPEGSYNIFAISTGTKLLQQSGIIVLALQNITVNFTLENDPAMSLSIVAGDLTNSTTKEPVGGAIVSLFSVEGNNTILKAVTYTNQYGQFVFREIQNGNYKVQVSALGYTDISKTISVTQSGSIIPMNISITANEIISKGTISGMIADSKNVPINRADVILYEVQPDQSLKAISFTKTNLNGIYLFINVPKGLYKIKSTQMELIEINVN